MKFPNALSKVNRIVFEENFMKINNTRGYELRNARVHFDNYTYNIIMFMFELKKNNMQSMGIPVIQPTNQ